MVICIVKVKALQLFNAFHDDKHYRRQNSPHNDKSGDELDMISFFNSAVSINLKNRENLLTKLEKWKHYGYEVLVLRQASQKIKFS